MDVDHPAAKVALAAVGVDLDALLAAAPYKIVGNPDRPVKPLYRLPEGVTVSRRALAWPDPNRSKLVTIFELRGGHGSQDVLPPSIHPDTKQAYTWDNERIPEQFDRLPIIPAELLGVWLDWGKLRGTLESACPWRLDTEPMVSQDNSGQILPDHKGDFDPSLVTSLFNAQYSPAEILERNGYQRWGKKWLAPGSTSRQPGVLSLGQDGLKVLSYHGSDPLGDGNPHDAYDCYRLLEHGGDWREAWHAAAGLLGVEHAWPVRGSEPTNDNETTPNPGGQPTYTKAVEIKKFNRKKGRKAMDERNETKPPEAPPVADPQPAANVTVLYAQMREVGVSLRLDSQTIYASPARATTPEIAEGIRIHKDELLMVLRARNKPAPTESTGTNTHVDSHDQGRPDLPGVDGVEPAADAK